MSPTRRRHLFPALLAVLAAALAGAFIAGCSPAQKTATPGASEAAPDPALWRLSDEDTTIWLFGSVHVLPADVRWRSARINAAFAGAQELMLETDVSAGAQPRIAALLASRGMQAQGRTLSADLDGETQARLGRVAQSLGLERARLEGMRPWLAGLQVSLAFTAQSGHAPEYGVEHILAGEAAARGMEVNYLETPEQQVLMLADLPDRDQAQFLAASLRQIEEDSSALDEIDAAWARGDVAALEAAVLTQLREAGDGVYSTLITDRNADWSVQLIRRLQAPGVVFVAVGSAHMLGAESVVAMLRARGYAVEGP